MMYRIGTDIYDLLKEEMNMTNAIDSFEGSILILANNKTKLIGLESTNNEFIGKVYLLDKERLKVVYNMNRTKPAMYTSKEAIYKYVLHEDKLYCVLESIRDLDMFVDMNKTHSNDSDWGMIDYNGEEIGDNIIISKDTIENVKEHEALIYLCI